MRNLKSSGIEVPTSSSPDLATSRRHFMSAATLVGMVLAAMLSPTRARAHNEGRGQGHGNGHGQGGGHGQGSGNGRGGVQCLLRGTQILTPQGERPVEDLQI